MTDLVTQHADSAPREPLSLRLDRRSACDSAAGAVDELPDAVGARMALGSETGNFRYGSLVSRSRIVGVIVAVEGPSAAGKTTWCRQLGVPYVKEYAPTGMEPDGSDILAQAAYWVEVNTGRWRAAERLEAQTGTAVCDSDPLKLHYSWCLARIGEISWHRFDQELQCARSAFERGDLGFVDAVVIAVPPVATLQKHRDSDPSRRRRSFDLHSRLRKPLTEWYSAVDDLDPGRVLWHMPEDGLSGLRFLPRPGRTNPALLDALVDGLPGQ